MPSLIIFKKNPPTPTNKTIAYEKDNNKNMQGEQEDRTNIHDIRKKQSEEECSNTRLDNEHKNDGENIVKTRYGRIVKKPGRLVYQQ